MGDINASIGSQAFFVSQRPKNNKLSLRTNNNSQFNDLAENTVLPKQHECLDNLAGQGIDANILRSDSLKSNFTAMEKFLERGINKTKPGCREPSNLDFKPASCVLEKKKPICVSGAFDKFKHPSKNCLNKSNEASSSVSGIVCIKTLFGKESGRGSGQSFRVSPNGQSSVNVEDCVRSDNTSSKENEKNRHDKNPADDANTPETNGSDILLCPLCWKSFESKDAQFTHMKACATKNKVSTNQLLQALELIQRQEAERKALGLPLLACKIPKKVKKDSLVTSIKPKNALDGNLQLGLALSVSFKESEQQKERDHLLEAGLFTEAEEKGLLPTKEVEEKNPLAPAPIFLNVGKKSTYPINSLPKTRNKNLKYGQGGKTPTLLKRTAEDRERLISEKVAIILIGDDNANPVNSALDDKNLKWEIKSEELRKYLNKENVLWEMANLSPSSSSKSIYYVDNLSSFISPCKVAAGSKLKHLSQIPGRNSTPDKSSMVQLHENADKGKLEISFPAYMSCDWKPDIGITSTKKVVKRNLFEENSKHLEFDLKPDTSITSTKKVLKNSSFEESFKPLEQNTLSTDWSRLVGNHEMSDITIYTQEDHEIPAHKLVFFVRCPAILKELVEEETRGKHSSCMLVWIETCHKAALEFLKYIYAGVLSKAEALSKTVLQDLNVLAERYEVKDLLVLLDKISCFSEVHENCLNSSCGSVDKNNFVLNLNHSLLPENSERSKSHQVEVEKNLDSDSVSPIVSDTGRNSPDIFETAVVMNSPSVKVIENEPEMAKKSDRFSDCCQDNRESIDYLVSLMEKDSSFHQSTENDPQTPECDDSVNNKGDVLNRISINTHVSESPTFLNDDSICDNFTEPITPKTPFQNSNTEDLMVYSTPALKETTVLVKSSNLVAKKDLNRISGDVKRKLMSSDDTDITPPTPKKLCIKEDKNFVDLENEEKEVVDLTQSGSEAEEMVEKASLNDSDIFTLSPPVNESCVLSPTGEMAEKGPLNDSVISTLPPPVNESRVLSPAGDKTVLCSPPDGPFETSYISNVWDDFDYIPDAHNVDLDKLYDSPKNSVAEEKKYLTPGDGSSDNCDENNLDNIADQTDKVPISPKYHDSLDHSILSHGEELGKVITSPVESAQISPEENVDITEKLLDASLQRLDNSIYWRDENEPSIQSEKCDSSSSSQTPLKTPFNVPSPTKETPAHLRRTNVTPLADYSAMKTPRLHKELDRYGIKHLKRNQAKQLLRHIYNELHPVVSVEAECSAQTSDPSDQRTLETVSPNSKKQQKGNKAPNKKKINFESLDSSSDGQSSSEEGSDSSSDSVILEESIYEPQFESPVKDLTLSQKGLYIDIPTAMKKLVESNPTLHRKILLYEPIWVNDIKTALKENGAKFNMNQLMDYLDEQCVTFRIAQGNRHQKRKKSYKKSAFSLSQPCNQKGKSKGSISFSQPC